MKGIGQGVLQDRFGKHWFRLNDLWQNIHLYNARYFHMEVSILTAASKLGGDNVPLIIYSLSSFLS